MKYLAVEIPDETGAELRIRLRDGALLGCPEIPDDNPDAEPLAEEWLSLCRDFATMFYRAWWKYKLKITGDETE